MSGKFHLTQGILPCCQNPEDTYGEICVHCDKCGRMKPAAIYWQERARGAERDLESERRTISALKGQITKAKKRAVDPPESQP